ncbi:MAG: hypothetical protein P8N71_07635 [Alphaproteobacteria bacterium]|nr:hypothetical protein [Alphaproteobacteria bacterium]
MIAAIKSVLRTIGFMKDSPLTTRQQLYDFIDSRAAFVSQVTLYTYVKARAGTQYPKLFQDADFLTSLRIARWHIYGAAICDLGLFAIAQLKRDGGLNDEAAQDLAIEMLDGILLDYNQDDIDPQVFAAIGDSGKQRAAVANWDVIADGPAAFQSSSDAVFRWAPIADALKNDDEEIVRNSIHLRWIGVRRDLKELIKPALILADWHEPDRPNPPSI